VTYLISAGFKSAKHMVFAGVYPADGSDYEALCHAMDRLTCNDASVSIAKESSGALGIGFRCGLHTLFGLYQFFNNIR
jgi:translation elongation factor EF-4